MPVDYWGPGGCEGCRLTVIQHPTVNGVVLLLRIRSICVGRLYLLSLLCFVVVVASNNCETRLAGVVQSQQGDSVCDIHKFQIITHGWQSGDVMDTTVCFVFLYEGPPTYVEYFVYVA